jgi:hypothetical protein
MCVIFFRTAPAKTKNKLPSLKNEYQIPSIYKVSLYLHDKKEKMEIKYSILSVILTFLGLYPDFKTISFEAVRESGGIASAKHGIIYQIKMQTKTGSNHLYFDYLYVDGLKIPIEIKNKQNQTSHSFEKKETILVIAAKLSKENPNEPKTIQNHTKSEFPIKYNGKALLSYWLNGKQKYLQIKEFKVIHVLKP